MKSDLVVADNLVRAHKLSGRSMKVLPICWILKVSFGGCKIDCSCMYCHCTELNVIFFLTSPNIIALIGVGGGSVG